MSISFIADHKNVNTASATTIAAPAFTLTTGQHVFVCVRYENTVATTVDLADTAGNTYTKLTEQATPGGTAYSNMWYCLNATGNASNVITCTFGEAHTYRVIHALQFSSTTALTYDASAYTTKTSTLSTTVTTDPFNTSGPCIVCAHEINFNSDTAESKTWSGTYALLDAVAGYNYDSATYKISATALSSETITYTGTGSFVNGRRLTAIAFHEPPALMGQAVL